MTLTLSTFHVRRDPREAHDAQRWFLKPWLGEHKTKYLGRLFGLDVGLNWHEFRLNLWAKRD